MSLRSLQALPLAMAVLAFTYGCSAVPTDAGANGGAGAQKAPATQPQAPMDSPSVERNPDSGSQVARMPRALTPQTGTVYLRAKPASTDQQVSVNSRALTLEEAIRLGYNQLPIMALDENVRLTKSAPIYADRLSLDEYERMIERAFDVRLSTKGNQILVVAWVNSSVNVPSGFLVPDSFRSAVLEALPAGSSLTTATGPSGSVWLGGSPNAVEFAETALEGLMEPTGLQYLVTATVSSPTDLYQTSTFIRGNGESVLSFQNGASATIEVNPLEDFNIASSFTYRDSSGSVQSFEFVSKSGNRVPVTRSTVNGQPFEVAYTVKAVEDVFGQ